MGLIYVPGRRIRADFAPDFPVEIDPHNELVDAGNLLFARLPHNQGTIATPTGRGGVFSQTLDIPTSNSARKGLLVAGIYRPTASTSAYGLWLGVSRVATAWTDAERVILTSAAAGTESHSTISHNSSGTNTYSMGLPSASLTAVTQYAIEYDGSISGKSAYAWRDGTKQAAFYTIGTFPWDTGVTRGPSFGSSGLSIYATYGYLFGPNSRIAIADILSALRENPYQIWRPKLDRRIWVPVGGAQTISFTNAAETDTAQAITHTKLKALTHVAESDAAQSIGHNKLKAVSSASESNAAQAVSHSKSKAVTQAAESDSAQAITPAGQLVVNVYPASEVGTAQALSVIAPKIISVGAATEDSFAQAIGRAKSLGVLHAAEGDTAQAIAHAKIHQVAQAVESDAAQVITAVGGYVPTLTLTQADLDAIADAVWETELETGYTARQMMRIMFATLSGNRQGLGTATELYMSRDGSKPRVTFTPTDAHGNGSTIVDGS